MAVYDAIIDDIRLKIATGTLLPGQRIGTELALAKEAGLSRSSIRAGIELLVQDGLVERKPGMGLFVTSVATAPKRAIAILAPVQSELWAAAVKGAQVKAGARGYKLQIYNMSSERELDAQIIRELPDTTISGALIISIYDPLISETIISIYQKHFPLVILDQRLYDVNIPSVTFSDYDVGYMAGKHLVECGHKSIGFIGYLHSHINSRLNGVRDAVNDAGLPFDRSNIKFISLDNIQKSHSHQLKKFTEEFFSNPAQKPTAILCSNDSLAGEFYRIARLKNIRIPEDISVIGCGDKKLCRFLVPELTTMKLHGEKMGTVAADLLIDIIEKSATNDSIHHTIPTQLVERDSVGKCS